MSFGEILSDSFKAALSNPGDISAALRTFRRLRTARSRDSDQAYQLRIGELARQAYKRAWQEEQKGSWHIQYRDDEFTIKVKSSYSDANDTCTTEVVIIPRVDLSGSHHHTVFDESGNVIYDQWRERS